MIFKSIHSTVWLENGFLKEIKNIVKLFFHFHRQWIIFKEFQKQSLASDENKAVKDENTQKEIEELRQNKAEESSRMKREFETGTLFDQNTEEKMRSMFGFIIFTFTYKIT